MSWRDEPRLALYALIRDVVLLAAGIALMFYLAVTMNFDPVGTPAALAMMGLGLYGRGATDGGR